MSKEPQLITQPMRFVLSDVGGIWPALCCPICGNTFVHPARVSVEQGSTKTVVVRETTCVQATDRSKHDRGSEIILAFWCEGGHRFEYRMAFSKGQLLCQLLACYSGPYLTDDELWRN